MNDDLKTKSRPATPQPALTSRSRRLLDHMTDAPGVQLRRSRPMRQPAQLPAGSSRFSSPVQDNGQLHPSLQNLGDQMIFAGPNLPSANTPGVAQRTQPLEKATLRESEVNDQPFINDEPDYKPRGLAKVIGHLDGLIPGFLKNTQVQKATQAGFALAREGYPFKVGSFFFGLTSVLPQAFQPSDRLVLTGRSSEFVYQRGETKLEGFVEQKEDIAAGLYDGEALASNQRLDLDAAKSTKKSVWGISAFSSTGFGGVVNFGHLFNGPPGDPLGGSLIRRKITLANGHEIGPNYASPDVDGLHFDANLFYQDASNSGFQALGSSLRADIHGNNLNKDWNRPAGEGGPVIDIGGGFSHSFLLGK